jgi:hypothetical protein
MDSLACNYNPLATEMGFVLCVFPVAEVCNASDDDCNGVVDDGLVFSDWFVDTDLDGYGSTFDSNSCQDIPVGFSYLSGDCNDADSLINPAAQEIPDNNIDENCDGQVPNIISEVGHNDLKLIPNPSKGEIQILGMVTSGTVYIYNAQGMLVMSKWVQKNERIQLDALSNGLYVVRFGNNFVQRLILSK